MNLPRLALLIVIMLAFVEMLVSNQLSTQGQKLGALEAQLVTLQKQNQLLSQELATASAIEKVASSAAELGFILPEKTISVTLPPSLAWNK